MFRTVLISTLVWLVAACAGQQTPIVESGPRYSSVESEIEDYRLASGDKLRIVVFNEESLSGEFSVGSNGFISLPLIGDLAADGKTPLEISEETRRRLADGYLREPRVSAEVVSYRPFFILGEVKAPGQYPYASGMTALNAVATAQGFTPRADDGKVFIRRSGSTQEEAYRLTPDLRILPGDTVRFGERFF